jgi:spore coat protein A, manganese oxidase
MIDPAQCCVAGVSYPFATTVAAGGCMIRFSRRQLLKCGIGMGALMTLPLVARAKGGKPGSRPLNGGRLAKYAQPLPVPGAGIVVATPTAPGNFAFTQCQIWRQLHPNLPPTPIWAYDDGSGLAGQAGSFGMAVVAQQGAPLTMSYTHALPETYPSWIPVDARLTPFGDAVRAMTHLHGGFVAGADDGNPGVTPNGYGHGDTQVAHYPNQQAASLLWFHDHAMGATRLNVFAGLAAAYVIRDGNDTGAEPNPIGIPGGPYEIPLVIQDRQFNVDGTFHYPTSDIDAVTWIGEYFGDVMLVNGKVWPYLDVEPRMYRLRVLNGCNGRILNLFIGGPTFWQIGAEGGMFDVPVPMKELVLAPAERADILVDFSKFAGTHLVMKNGRPKRPVVTPARVLEQVMQFRVGTTVTAAGPSSIPASLPGRRAALPSPARTRYITLNEVEVDEPEWMLNLSGLPFDAPATENPKVNDVEDWVYVNMTMDTHPMHLHLVTFQVVGRTRFDVEAYAAEFGGEDGVPGGHDPTPFATGPMQAPAPEERGFKDTVKANPGFFTTIRARFELPLGVDAPQSYVHHCHIVEHEDNDMMRPFVVESA